MAAAFIRNSKRTFSISILLAIAAVSVAMLPQGALAAQGQAAQPPEREVIPGADRMSSVEREAYRQRMQAASTQAEKAKIRAAYEKTAETASTTLVGDAERGSKLHRGCFGCHGIERYTQPVTLVMATFTDSMLRASGLSDLPPSEPARFKGRIQSLAALRDAVTRRNDYLNPKMSPQEIADVVAYLNATYYKFE